MFRIELTTYQTTPFEDIRTIGQTHGCHSGAPAWKFLKPPAPPTRSRMISDVQRAPTISRVWQPDKECSWSAQGHLDAAGEASRSFGNSPRLLQALDRCPCTPRNQEGKHRPKARRSLG